jgi:hypothetical protein
LYCKKDMKRSSYRLVSRTMSTVLILPLQSVIPCFGI